MDSIQRDWDVVTAGREIDDFTRAAKTDKPNPGTQEAEVAELSGASRSDCTSTGMGGGDQWASATYRQALSHKPYERERIFSANQPSRGNRTPFRKLVGLGTAAFFVAIVLVWTSHNSNYSLDELWETCFKKSSEALVSGLPSIPLFRGWHSQVQVLETPSRFDAKTEWDLESRLQRLELESISAHQRIENHEARIISLEARVTDLEDRLAVLRGAVAMIDVEDWRALDQRRVMLNNASNTYCKNGLEEEVYLASSTAALSPVPRAGLLDNHANNKIQCPVNECVLVAGADGSRACMWPGSRA